MLNTDELKVQFPNYNFHDITEIINTIDDYENYLDKAVEFSTHVYYFSRNDNTRDLFSILEYLNLVHKDTFTVILNKDNYQNVPKDETNYKNMIAKLLDKTEGKIICNICFDDIEHMISCGECGESMCHGCIYKLIQQQNIPSCPFCRTKFDDLDIDIYVKKN
jgi:hypothetical protein